MTTSSVFTGGNLRRVHKETRMEIPTATHSPTERRKSVFVDRAIFFTWMATALGSFGLSQKEGLPLDGDPVRFELWPQRGFYFLIRFSCVRCRMGSRFDIHNE